MQKVCEKRIDSVVASAVEGSGMFYAVRFEPPPSKTCFDVTLKTYGPPYTEYIVTVAIPPKFPFSPPAITCKTDKNMKFLFLEENQWKPSTGIVAVLIEACSVISRRDLVPRAPVLPRIRPPQARTPTSASPAKSPQKAD
ncbi:UBC core domain-containing protein [Caenorhabditis elegans]|uniref:UBC core domain-containing protein n=1 Tax=Caenorhabditis elegans TaxID=6239 RepID=O62069_CAEEL|nr:UBC core domain-containing protein [Caenorhabditis elegans]CAB03893.2 UBC core domain-containing protein [Caenorhabditis elegans]|eukprot:NP_492956.2 Uncharacterized protein CELE_C17D12.5 [Caenorhabditis elegans]